MARLARVVAPGLPHHITQRGNRRQLTFLREEDYKTYLYLMADWCSKHKVDIWAYCLMPNHVHLIAVPPSKEDLTKAIGEAHRRYTCQVNSREGWKGHLWQGRFYSFPLAESHLYAVARYIELNPVRAGLTEVPWHYPWSSAHAHLTGQDDMLVKVGPLLEMFGDWQAYLAQGLSETEAEIIRRHERTGRPLGDENFLASLEQTLGQELKPRKRGPKPRSKDFGDTILNYSGAPE
ncbi:MAG: transposase [Bacillota bacterium]